MDSKAIRVLRGLRGATQREIARVAQISPATLSLLANGQTAVSQETLAKILAAVGYTAAMESHLGALIALAGHDESYYAQQSASNCRPQGYGTAAARPPGRGVDS